MCSSAECTPEHRAYTAHIMGCRSCYAPNRRHCETGWQLKLECDARFVVGLTSLDDRRRWMQRLRIEIPEHIERLEAVVRRMYGDRRSG